MKAISQNNLRYYQFEHLSPVRHGIFTRQGGSSSAPWASLNMGGNVGDDSSAVRRNHDLMYKALKLNGNRACTVWQVHSADTIVVHAPVAGRRWLALADGMVTDQPDTPLTMRFADCTPLLFHDPVQGVIGIAHAGWRGTVAGMASHLVETMRQAYGCFPANIRVGIGPCIGPEHYQVGEEVVEAVQAYFGRADGLIHRSPDDGTAYFDLWAANQLDLERAGIVYIEQSGISTASHTHEFFSHRAEKGRTGRFGAVISL